MLQRDKENRELRKLKQRTPKGNPKQAHENREQYQIPDTSVEENERKFEKKTIEKEKADANHLSK